MKGNQVGGIAWLNNKIKAIAKRVTKNEQDIDELNSKLADGNVKFSVVDGELYYSVYTEESEV